MKVVLTKPVVGVQLDTRIEETLPRGSEIEVSQNSPRGWVEISCNGSSFSVFPEDLLDATAGDAAMD
jgi:hypothetical protein